MILALVSTGVTVSYCQHIVNRCTLILSTMLEGVWAGLRNCGFRNLIGTGIPLTHAVS